MQHGGCSRVSEQQKQPGQLGCLLCVRPAGRSPHGRAACAELPQPHPGPRDTGRRVSSAVGKEEVRPSHMKRKLFHETCGHGAALARADADVLADLLGDGSRRDLTCRSRCGAGWRRALAARGFAAGGGREVPRPGLGRRHGVTEPSLTPPCGSGRRASVAVQTENKLHARGRKCGTCATEACTLLRFCFGGSRRRAKCVGSDEVGIFAGHFPPEARSFGI